MIKTAEALHTLKHSTLLASNLKGAAHNYACKEEDMVLVLVVGVVLVVVVVGGVLVVVVVGGVLVVVVVGGVLVVGVVLVGGYVRNIVDPYRT